MSINFMKVHQPNMPHPDYIHKSMSKSKYADSVVELDARIGRIMDKIRSLPNASNTLVFYTTDNGAWQDVYPDAGYTPFRGTKGTLREGGNRVPAVAWMPGKIAPNSKNHEIVGGLDLMATFASVGGASCRSKIVPISRSSSTATTCRRSCSAPASRRCAVPSSQVAERDLRGAAYDLGVRKIPACPGAVVEARLHYRGTGRKLILA